MEGGEGLRGEGRSVLSCGFLLAQFRFVLITLPSLTKKTTSMHALGWLGLRALS